MLLAVDIGNTNISLGIFKGSRLLKRHNLPTKEKNYSLTLKSVVSKNKIDDAIICSVVPLATNRFSKALQKLTSKKPYIVGKDLHVPVKNLYRYPKQVGQDRLVNAYAGIKLYSSPLVVVDFGTAVTFDVVSKKKEYLGGMILPGLAISLEALNLRTALLPKAKLSKPKEFIGKDTESSMLSGIVYGFAALTDELIQRIKKKIGRKAKVIGTGGNIFLIKPYCEQLDNIDADITLKGLSLTYAKLLCQK